MPRNKKGCPCCVGKAARIADLPEVEETQKPCLSPMEAFKAKKPANRKKKRKS